MSRTDWKHVVAVAAEIVESYSDTSVTLRQLFYRLVATGLLANTRTNYKTLSERTAEARRAGRFPKLIDRTRSIHRYQTFDDDLDALDWLAHIYRRDRTEGQDWSAYLGVEKAGIVEQLTAWFGDYGVPILALGGYASQSYVDEVAADVAAQRRPSVLLYAGDFDPSGEDIDRDFVARTGCFDRVERVALTAEQVDAFDLPPQMGKATDTRAAGFVEKHGALVQVELDALPPEQLRALYEEAFGRYWDMSVFREVLHVEASERERLRGVA